MVKSRNVFEMSCSLFIILKNKNKLVFNSLKNKHNTVSLKFIILLLKAILHSVKIKIV